MLSFSQKQLRDFRGRDISTIFQNPMTSLDPVFKIGNQMVEMIRNAYQQQYVYQAINKHYSLLRMAVRGQ